MPQKNYFQTEDDRAAFVIDIENLKSLTSDGHINTKHLEVNYFDNGKKIKFIEPSTTNCIEKLDENDSAESSESDVLSTSKKPSRPCLFCPDLKLQANLKRHLQRHHKDKVEWLTQMSPMKQRNEFKKIRLQGIYELNKKSKSIDGAKAKLQRARKTKGSGPIKICTICKIVVSRSTFYKHKCVAKTPTKRPVAVDANPGFTPSLIENKEFLVCLSKIRDDRIGNTIKESPDLLYLGERLFAKTNDAKPIEKQKRVNAYLRKMGRILVYFQDHVEEAYQFVDIFTPKYLDTMKNAIMDCIQYGLSQLPMYVDAIKYSCARLSNRYFQEENEEMAKKFNLYSRCFSDMNKESFKSLSDNLQRQHNKRSRDPKELLDDDTVSRIINECESSLNIIDYTVQGFADNFISVRRHLCALLTLENSRRGRS